MGVNHKVCDVSVHLIKVISGCRGVGGRAGEGQGRRVVLREDWFWNRLAGGGRGGKTPGERIRREAREGDKEDAKEGDKEGKLDKDGGQRRGQ